MIIKTVAFFCLAAIVAAVILRVCSEPDEYEDDSEFHDNEG